TASPYI
ncbi:unnamed protein product, partial [Rhizophagus irregularis]